MGSKKLKLVISSGLLLVLLFLGLYSFGDIKYSAKEGLSYSEKKRDAEYLMQALQDTYLYFDEIKADGKFTSPNYESMGFSINFILPNSNLPITSNTVKIVDEEGIFIEKKVVAPQIILKRDKSKILENFREEILYIDYQKDEELYNDEDEYFKEVIKLIE